MGSYSEEPEFKTISVKPLHPTFAAEVDGVDFKNLSDEQFKEIFAAMAKVRAKQAKHTALGFLYCLFLFLSSRFQAGRLSRQEQRNQVSSRTGSGADVLIVWRMCLPEHRPR